MKIYELVLKLSAPIFLLVGLLHLIFGVGAEVMIGARLPAEALSDPVLDSQNRFYGISFSLYGVLLFLCATDLKKYGTVLRCVLWAFFAAGLARLVSIATHGMPSMPVLVLLGSEIVLPPLLIGWFSKLAKEY